MQNSSRTFWHHNIYFILLLALTLALSGIIGKSFYSKGEPREALVSQSMINSGDWILPSRYGDEFATKPPFSHWIAASLSLVTGQNSELEARLPSLILSLLSLVFFFSLIKKYASSELAGLSCLLLLTSIEWHRASITARVDMTLSAMIIIALASLFNWEKGNFRGYPMWALIGITGATLSKGPVGLALPAAIVGCHYLLEGRRLINTILKCTLVFLPALAFSSLWYLAAYSRGGDAFLETFMLENLSRFQGTMELGEDPHNHSAFYLYGTVLLGMIPWTFIVIPALLQKVSVNKKHFNISMFNPRQLWNKLVTLNPLDRFALISIVFYLVFFSIPSSKRSVYLLPIYPFLAYFTARFALLLGATKQRSLTVVSNILVGLLIFFGLIIFTPLLSWISIPSGILSAKALSEFNFYKNAISSGATNLGAEFIISSALVLAAVWVAFKNKRTDGTSGIIRAAILMGLGLAITNITILKGITDNLSAKAWASQLSNEVDLTIPAYTYKERNYGLNYYMNGNIRVAESTEAIKLPSYVFVKNDLDEEFINLTKHLKVTDLGSSPNPIERTKRLYKLYQLSAQTIEIR
jgi:4-amino-4-deoxy-L-arabinose transferase-like glycosyltransferase